MQAIQRTRSSALSVIHGIFVVSLVCSVALASAASGMITNPSVDDNRVTAGIVFPGGIAGELLLSFEDASDLNLNNLNLLAELVDPGDPALLDCLPAGVQIPSEFPVLITIGPSGGSTLSFRGRWSLELVTENLEFTANTPLRLFKAPDGGAFEDVTSSLGLGSLRVLGVGSDFSEFLITADLRTVDSEVEVKHPRLQTALDDAKPTIPDMLFDTLQSTLDTARQSYLDGRLKDAIDDYLLFAATVLAASGTTIPDEWTPDGPENLAGKLRVLAESLIFSVIVEACPSPNFPCPPSKLIFSDGFVRQHLCLEQERSVARSAQDTREGCISILPDRSSTPEIPIRW